MRDFFSNHSKKLAVAAIIALVAATFFLPAPARAARTDALWDYIAGGNYMKPNGSASGVDILMFGSNRYINFGSATGVNGYGFRDNTGTMEFKNSGGAWTPFGTGTGGVSTTSANTWTATQTFSVAPIFSSLSGLLQGNGSSAVTAISGTQGQFPYYNGTNTVAATSSIFLTQLGNIGIGTTTPGTALHVAGQIQQTFNGPIISTWPSVGGTYVGFSAQSGGLEIAGVQFNTNDVKVGAFRATYPLRIFASNAEAIRIDTSGNVGVGFTSPTAKFHVQASTTDGTAYALRLQNSATGNILAVRNDQKFDFGSGTENTQLSVVGTGSASGIYSPSYSSSATNIIRYKDFNGNIRMTLDMSSGTDGKLGIASTTPGFPLSVAGASYLGGNLTATGTVTFTGLSTGIVKNTSGVLSTAANGTDYSLITALTCPGSDFVSAVTAAGVFTCSTPSGGTGGGLSTSTPWTAGNLAWVVDNARVSSIATTTLSGNSQVAVSNSPVLIGASPAVLSIVADSIGDTQLAFNTGQNLTTASSPTFAGATIGTLTGLIKGASGVLSAASAGTDYEVPLTFSTGLTRSTNTVTVNTSQNIAKLTNLTSNGFVKTSAGDGTLSIDTSTYLTGNQTITLSGDVSGSGTTAITTTIGALKVLGSMIANATIDLTTKVTGVLPMANGGTDQFTNTKGDLLAGTGSAWAKLAVGTNGKVLTASSTATNGVSWEAASGSSLTGTTGQVPYFSGTNTAVGTSTIFVSVDNNVGIGTTTPTAQLTIDIDSITDSPVVIFGKSLTASTTQTQVFESSGTWTKPTGFYSATVTVVGAGGGGGANSGGVSDNGGGGGGSSKFAGTAECTATGGGGGSGRVNGGAPGTSTSGGAGGSNPGTASRGGGGGGSGAQVVCTYLDAGLGSTVTITVGNNGLGGGTSSNPGTGGTGLFNGGGGAADNGGGGGGAGRTGNGGTTTTTSGGAAGTGSSTGGTVTNGTAGSNTANTTGAIGGPSPMGGLGGVANTAPVTPSYPGTLTYGAGGGGGTQAIAAGPGAKGVVVVTSTIGPIASTGAQFVITPITNVSGIVEEYVGIGTSTPMAKLSVKAASSTPPLAIVGTITTNLGMAVDYVFEVIDAFNHIYTSGPVPTVNSCAGFSAAAGSNDRTGTITLTSGTSCAFNFASAWTVAPVCTISPGSALSTVRVVTTTTSVTVTLGSANTSFGYICQAQR